MDDKQQIKTPWAELNEITQISREELHHSNGMVSVEFRFKSKDGEEHYFFYNCVEGEEIPQTIQEAIGEVGQIMPMVPGGEC